jgi:hypothetical protein
MASVAEFEGNLIQARTGRGTVAPRLVGPYAQLRSHVVAPDVIGALDSIRAEGLQFVLFPVTPVEVRMPQRIIPNSVHIWVRPGSCLSYLFTKPLEVPIKREYLRHPPGVVHRILS